MPTYHVGELFCGAGGLASGAKNALIVHQGEEYRFSHAWATDIDPWACETFRKNIVPDNPDAVICSDIRELDIPHLAPIDGLLFGFPCNDFSQVGEQRGINGEYGPLYQYGVQVLNAHNPLFFLAENVSGLSTADEGETLKQIIEELRTAGRWGYTITAHLYKFEEYGVPQCRHRIIIVGFRNDQGLQFRVPAPTHENAYVSCAEALRGVENVPYNNEKTRHSRTTVERLSYIPQGGNAWHPNVPEHLRLKVKGCQLSQIYRRLSADQPAYTITGSGGGGTHVYHWEEPRALTNRERARLQTFDDNFIFYGPKESVRAQIGHAVPPKAAHIILEAVLKCFAGVEYPNTVASICQDALPVNQAEEQEQAQERIQERLPVQEPVQLQLPVQEQLELNQKEGTEELQVLAG